jgi:hypothetical protein
MNRFWILDFGFWIEHRRRDPGSRNPKSQIQNPKLLTAAAAVLIATAAVTQAATPKPTPTPTPRPRKLSGGFGRGAADTVTPPPGQSLADAVRAASETKKRKETKGKISITNETLVTDPRKGKLTTASPRATPAPVPTAPSEEAPAAGTPPEAEAEAYWRERAHTARNRVTELEEQVRRTEQEARKLENDFYSWDDGNYRDGVIKPAWDRKREELETARRELVDAQKELADLPEKARKAGALPGWLRE